MKKRVLSKTYDENVSLDMNELNVKREGENKRRMNTRLLSYPPYIEFEIKKNE